MGAMHLYFYVCTVIEDSMCKCKRVTHASEVKLPSAPPPPSLPLPPPPPPSVKCILKFEIGIFAICTYQ